MPCRGLENVEVLFDRSIPNENDSSKFYIHFTKLEKTLKHLSEKIMALTNRVKFGCLFLQNYFLPVLLLYLLIAIWDHRIDR